ncbi:VanW family protein [Actinomycetospora cinnamomea]|uniref:Vancomycin resistance protein YoaR n=1 Tax=Actinomycetospora cinnamomea TaxID=663609 RepID=A0A2U1FFN9_9PSEU|nr:VanW family protein [Actinomycetospora cinnamomea]PVZ10946.1 vancomycin resistance protein YoaR [Actinomycetospora cinnamomea]
MDTDAPQGAEAHDEPTRTMTGEAGPEHDVERTEWIPVTDQDRGHTADGSPDGSPGRRRPVLIGAAVVGLLAVLYVGDLLFSSTAVPRGVTVAGVEIGGMGKPEAEQTLRTELASRVERPVTLQAGSNTATIDPQAAGLELDVEGTIAEAGEQPFNPWTRVTSLFTTREIAPVTRVNAFALGQALDGARPQLDRPAVEGTVRFEGVEPVAVPSVPGQAVDGPGAARAVTEHWLDPTPVALPVVEAPVTVTAEGIQEAIDQVARPAVAGPVTVVGDAKNATITTRAITTFLVFRPDGQGGLVPAIDEPAAIAAVEPQLATTEAEPRDATLQFSGTQATVVPAVVGREIDWARTFSGLVEALGRPAGEPAPPVFTPPPAAPGAEPASPPPASGRAINAVYTTTQPEVTTEQLQALGPAEIIGEFTTRGFKPDSGQNIRRIAEIVNGKVIAPNSVFSLNAATSPRNEANGFVPAGIIDDGAPGRGVGGGVSQFATTLYNAGYFAGLDDVEHKEHSYYISRYPAGREATVFEGSIDLRLGNDGPAPVYIRTQWTPSAITVQLYGIKRYDVTSEQGPRTNQTPPGTRDLGGDPECSPSQGSEGFTITDTRVLRDVRTGEVRREPRTVRYEPQPTVTCNG